MIVGCIITPPPAVTVEHSIQVTSPEKQLRWLLQRPTPLAVHRHAGYSGRMEQETQSAGRAPAPGDLELVQDFVNTLEVDTGADDLPDPEALAAWLAGHRLLGSGERLGRRG